MRRCAAAGARTVRGDPAGSVTRNDYVESRANSAVAAAARRGRRPSSGRTSAVIHVRMIAAYLETQCHVVALLGYRPDEHGISAYTLCRSLPPSILCPWPTMDRILAADGGFIGYHDLRSAVAAGGHHHTKHAIGGGKAAGRGIDTTIS